MEWEAPKFTRIPTGTELGYTNELDREPPPRPERERQVRRERKAR